MKDKIVVEKSKKYRKVFGFIGAIKLVKGIMKKFDIEELFSLADSVGAEHTKTVVTSICPDDGDECGYIEFKKGDHVCHVEYDCCGLIS